MRLQNKNFTFTIESSNDKPMSRVLTSNVVIDGKLTEIQTSQLFYGIKRERANVVRGYSPLEFLNENGEIQIDERVYKISFVGDKDNFILKSHDDPENYTLEDKTLNESDAKQFEQLITSSAPTNDELSHTQPRVDGSETERESNQTGADLITVHEKSDDYNGEVSDLTQIGYVEHETNPISNHTLLVRVPEENMSDEQIQRCTILIERTIDDYEIIEKSEYEITDINPEQKTFTWQIKNKES